MKSTFTSSLRSVTLAGLLVPCLVAPGCSGGDDGPAPDAAVDAARLDAADAAVVADARDAPLADGGVDGAGDLSSEVDAGEDGPAFEVPPAAALQITPLTHDFGNVPKDMIVTTFFMVKNTGGQPTGAFDVKLMNGNLDPDAFAMVSNGCETSMEPEAMCEMEIRFFANVLGMHQGLLTVSASPGGTVSAELKATGVP